MTLIETLYQTLGKARVTINATILQNHGQDLTYHSSHDPDVVVFPSTKEDVSEVMKIAAKYQSPVTAYGAGSSIEGHTIPVTGGVVIDFSEMNHIIEIRPDDFIVKVEPGVTRKQLNKALKAHGLFFPVDPGADASIGGMTATNASGTNTVKYGGMKANVLGIEAVLATGEIMTTGGTSFKTSAGYDLKNLLIGSEGTLGLITEITLKLTGIPEVIHAAKATFPTLRKAGEGAAAMLKSGIPIARMELVDEETILAVNQYNETNYKIAPSLFLEFDGSEASVLADRTFAEDVLKGAGALTYKVEKDEKERQKLWHARHEAALSVTNLLPGKRLTSTDVCVPISELANALTATREMINSYTFKVAAVLGHVGDGNFHVVIGVDPENREEVNDFKALNKQIVELALSKGGTCSGEHGIGIGKKDYLLKEHPSSVPVMKQIKSALDPMNLLNPGKIFD